MAPPLPTPPAAVMAGANGASVSTVTVIEPDVPDTLPASSVAVVVNACDVCVRGVSGRQLQLPWASTVTRPTSTFAAPLMLS
ncbi:hypothetical protein D3C78_505660 [compost metagenome]